MTKIDLKYGTDLKKFGAGQYNSCYNCGNCTAVCSLSTKEDSFPREMVRLTAIGAEDEIESSLKPWLCYYCGECTTYCPQTAGPGELMMSLRRWLTARYDWTGLSGLLYKSMTLTIVAMVLVLAAVVGYAAAYSFDMEKIMHFGHLFEMYAIITVFAFIIMPNVARMWYFTTIKPGKKVAFKTYLTGIGEFLIHMFTQKRTLGCDNSQKRWFEHFILVLGYLSLLFTTVFLDWFGSSNTFVIVLGYVMSAIVFIVTFDFVGERIRKKREMSKNSQPSDWFFVIWLMLMGVTAFVVRLFIDLDMLESNKWLYLFHLMILAQWALIIVPFGKWTHFIYRSFAMYLHKILK